MIRSLGSLAAILVVSALGPGATRAADNVPPPGFKALFNGKDLSGWKILPHTREHWKVVQGVLTYDGKDDHLITAKDYGNFVLMVDWKITPGGDSGIYLRGKPQVQIWDNPIGSGGLYNDGNNPTRKMDRPVGEWNHFEITLIGNRCTVVFNGATVVKDFPMKGEYTDARTPTKGMPKTGPIYLQHHNSPLYFKNIYIKELP